jgi:4-aminobutyrate aminotransferase/(S)-3-amino-2-methylpropionate transaminase
MGEPTKMVLLEKVVEVVLKRGLVEKAKTIGRNMLDGLMELEKKFPNLVNF